MKPPEVTILLSTFNGERYIAEQLESLYQQTFSNFFILVRDDGSTDDTVKIINGYVARYDNIKLLEGENIGVVLSFFTLLKNSPVSPFYAFCDQDDVWLPHKLSMAVKQLNVAPSPSIALYCSRLQYTDHALKSLGRSLLPVAVGFGNAVVENSAIGCTAVFGDGIKFLMLKANPGHVMMHDWWVYLLASAFGVVLYDDEPTLYYRQHPRNVVGINKNFMQRVRKAAYFFNNLVVKRNGFDSLRQAEYFLNTYPEMPVEKRQLIIELFRLRSVGSMIDRYRFLKQSPIYRNKKSEQFILKLAVLLKLH